MNRQHFVMYASTAITWVMSRSATSASAIVQSKVKCSRVTNFSLNKSNRRTVERSTVRPIADFRKVIGRIAIFIATTHLGRQDWPHALLKSNSHSKLKVFVYVKKLELRSERYRQFATTSGRYNFVRVEYVQNVAAGPWSPNKRLASYSFR
jgi:hypothetical protein